MLNNPFYSLSKLGHTVKATSETLVKSVAITALATSALYAKDIEVSKAASAVVIDGVANESAWAQAEWLPMTELMVGDMPAPEDFSGRYKLLWNNGQLFLMAEIVDDVLWDNHPDPIDKYWDDDCLEIFIDADASGGNHLTSYNAFAYHIALDGNVLDIGPNKGDKQNYVILNDHAYSRWTRSDKAPFAITWEVSIKIFPDTFTEDNPGEPLTLSADQVIGFMLAYCDNDGSEEREHFVGSHAVEAVNGSKNLGYIDASVFGKIVLKP